MNELVLTFQATQDAIEGERKLIDAGIEVRVITAQDINSGSGIYLAIYQKYLKKARLLLGATIKNIYIEDKDREGFEPWTP